MLTILLVVVAVAYWISAGLGQLAGAGAELLAQVREGTLAKHWPSQAGNEYFLITGPSGQNVGWVINTRVITDEGYRGTTTLAQSMQGPAGMEYSSKQWMLSSDAAKGSYRAVTSSKNIISEMVDIKIAGGQVTVAVRAIDPRLKLPVTIQARSPAPSNYIPEGLMDLMVCQIARTGRHAMFRMILNDQAIQGKEVAFVPVECKPAGGKVVKLSVGASARTYTFDDDWQLQKIQDSTGAVTTRASLDDLKKAFAQDELLQKFNPATQAQPEASPETAPMPSPAQDDEPVEIT
jgi:hypothetical protein